MYTADPSAHVFNNKIYIYPSHDIDAGEAFDDLGSHFAMEDYHVIRMNDVNAEAIDCGEVLHVNDVPWAEKQMWAPDAAHKNGKYYLYFPAKDYDGIFRIGGVGGVSDAPDGPFIPEPEAIKNSFSIDPAVFEDEDGKYYMYFGGLWGGQLQRWREGTFNPEQPESPVAFLPKDDEPALLPYVAKMSDDMLEFADKPKEVQIVDENGALLLAGDNDRRFLKPLDAQVQWKILLLLFYGGYPFYLLCHRRFALRTFYLRRKNIKPPRGRLDVSSLDLSGRG